MASCTAMRKDGLPCRTAALAGSEHCFGHAPDQAERRQQARQQGGRNSSLAARATKNLPPHLANIPQRLLTLIDRVEKEEITPAAATAIGALVGKLLDLARLSIEQNEQREVLERLAALEALRAGPGMRGTA